MRKIPHHPRSEHSKPCMLAMAVSMVVHIIVFSGCRENDYTAQDMIELCLSSKYQLVLVESLSL
jgi:hypothetical protein